MIRSSTTKPRLRRATAASRRSPQPSTHRAPKLSRTRPRRGRQNNAGNDLAIAPNGTGADRFDFPTDLSAAAPYAVTVKAQPGAPAQACAVGGGTGTVGAADVTVVTGNNDSLVAGTSIQF